MSHFSINQGFFIYLTPCVPLSFKGEGEGHKKEGRKPLLDTLDERTLDKARLTD